MSDALRLLFDYHPDRPTGTLALYAGETTLESLEVPVFRLGEAEPWIRARLLPHLEKARRAGWRVNLELSDPATWVGTVLQNVLAFAFDGVGLAGPVTLVRTDAPAKDPDPIPGPLEDEVPLPPPTSPPAAPVTPRPSSTQAGRQQAGASTPRSFVAVLWAIETQVHRGSARPDESLVREATTHPQAPADAARQVEKRVRRGTETHAAMDRFERDGRAKGSAAVAQLASEMKKKYPWLSQDIEKKLKWLAAAESRRKQDRERRRETQRAGIRASSVDHRIQVLKPAARWTLLVDETGSAEVSAGPRQGRFVGLLVPEPSPLPALKPGWHATDEADLGEIDRVIQSVLDAPVGILGLTVEALPEGPDRWVGGVLELVEWVVRLLPMDGRTTLAIEVEQHGDNKAGAEWRVALAQLHRALSAAAPGRYGQLRLELRLVAKSQQLLNGYVDALAFTWGSPAGHSRDRLTVSGLVGPCLHSGDAAQLRSAWDRLGRGIGLNGDEWLAVVTDVDAQAKGSLPAHLLRQLAESCRADATLWSRYLEAARAHLDGKAVDLRRLSGQVLWLESCRPPAQALPPILELAWLTAKAELVNHYGGVGGFDSRMKVLCERLFDEVPDVVCQAELNQAVLATNRFDFDGATAALSRWMDLPAAVPGLQHWARVQSSAGQHLAFQGKGKEALAFFDRAIDAFGRLSDDRRARGEISQTASYAAFAAMDCPSVPDAETRTRMERVVSLAPAEIGRLAASVIPGEKYAHHLLLRWLVTRGDETQRAAYLSAREDWEVGEGHPWQLIEAYRGILVRALDAGEARARMASAWELSKQQGPTVQFIGLVIAHVAAGWGAAIEGATAIASELKTTLPLAPWSALKVPPADAAATLETCLPFNFR